MHLFWRIWFISLGIKILISYFFPLSPDEAYYWIWSKHLQLSYFDHPGMVAWLFKLGEPFETWGHLCRMPFLLLSHGTYYIWKQIFQHLDLNTTDTPKSFSSTDIWLLLALSSPITGFGGLVATPDIPLLFFWSCSLLAFIYLCTNPKSILTGILLGSFLGLGFCSKYHMVLFVPLAFIFIFIKKIKIHIPTLIALILAGLLFSSPVLIWNYSNQFKSFLFQFNHGLSSNEFSYSWIMDYLFGTIILVSPIIFYWSFLNFKKNLLLAIFGFGPFVFFTFTSLRAHVELNWPSIAYPSIFALAILNKKSYRSLSYVSYFWIFIYTILFISFLNPQTRYLNTKLHEPFVFEKLKNLPLQYSPFYAGNYQLASSLSYFSKKDVLKLPQINRFDFFDELTRLPLKEQVFYLLKEDHVPVPQWMLEQKWIMTDIGHYGRNLVLLKCELK
ncbi:MAG: ArnT family glycosyltransferase [Pseudobdellovibrionaceae bacterium]